ncbi:hypothetical protein [Streptomyces sp. NPDC005476]|uniref:hypothetical protein n=1 Tax=Streptomyces sp. NPDC005476 TaxID=3156882 RepID=UPI00345445ED
MTPHEPRGTPPRSRAWLRTLVLLLALLVPGSAAEIAATAPVTAAASAEYDVLDTALRPAPCVHRPATAPRPAQLPPRAPEVSADRPRPLPHRPPYALRTW